MQCNTKCAVSQEGWGTAPRNTFALIRRGTGWIDRYRLLVVVYGLALAVGVRESLLASRGGASEGGPVACEASAAPCVSVSARSLPVDDSAFWERHSAEQRGGMAVRQPRREPLAREPSLLARDAPATSREAALLKQALAEVGWVAGSELERYQEGGTERWRVHLSFRPGHVVDMRDAMAAVTVLAIPEADRSRYRVTCQTLVDCTATRVPGR